ncbi:hypothetical protein TNCV_763561 [Trichonephila clavipes]|nr:hypothetical protein TNCV_763561 [Trichonephila clavipes]
MTLGVGPVCLGRRQFGCRTTITGTKAEPAFIRKHNRFPLHPPMSSSLAPLASETGKSADVRSYGPDLALLANGGVQQQPQHMLYF